MASCIITDFKGVFGPLVKLNPVASPALDTSAATTRRATRPRPIL